MFLCDDLEGWKGGGGGRENQEGRNICILMSDSCCCTEKLIQHYKPIIFQKIKINNFFKARHLISPDIWMDNKHMKRCSTPLIIRETQIKTTVRCPLTLVRMAITKKCTNNMCCRGCGEKGTTLYCG